MRLWALALISGAALGLEVLLTRLLAIIHWHHFTAVVISLALLGFAASGTLLALAGEPARRRCHGLFALASAVFALTAPSSILLAQRLPFNALEILWDPWQPVWLLLVYLLLTLPFLAAGTAIGLALAAFREHPGRIYGADLLGAGAGAVLVSLALFPLPPLLALHGLGLIGVAAALLVLPLIESRRLQRLGLGLSAVAAALIVGLWAQGPELRLSPFKALPQLLETPGAEITHERSTPRGHLSLVASPEVPLRRVPGLSLAATQEPAEQMALFTDGDDPAAITRWPGERERLAYLDMKLAALPYHLLDEPEVTAIGLGGGGAVLDAVWHGAAEVTTVELDPAVVDIFKDELDGFTGGLLDRPEVETVIAEGRHYLARAGEPTDLLVLPMIDGLAGAGRVSLHASHLYTREAFDPYLDRLTEDGLLAIERWTRVPPRASLRLLATAIATLEARGVEAPGDHLAMLRGWDTALLLVAASPLSETRIATLKRFAEERSFDLAWYPGIAADEANRFNRLDEPYFHEAARALLSDDRRDFIARYKFAIDPVSDDRPFFFDFFRWHSMEEVLRVGRMGNATLLDWGHLIQAAALIIAVVLGLLLIVAPLALSRFRREGRGGRGVAFATALLVGLAFLMCEIAVIQKLVLFLGRPVFAFVAGLAGFLVFAGLGATLGARLERWPEATRRRSAALGAGLLVVVLAFALPTAAAPVLALPAWAAWVIALALIAPPALLMGMPFPALLAELRESRPGLQPWAWAVNGCASVVAAPLASILAVHLGFTLVMLTASLLYLLAGLVPALARTKGSAKTV